MVTLLDHDAIPRLSRMLRKIDLGDKILTGKVNLFKLNSKPIERLPKSSGYLWLAQAYEEVCQDERWADDSSLGSMKSKEGKLRLIHLSQVLYYCFPEHDFDTLTPDHFLKHNNPMEVIHSINSHDFSNLPNLDNCSNFVTTFWSLVRECIDFTAIGPQQQQSQTQSQQQNQINSKNNNNSQNQIQNQTVSGLTQSQTQSQQRICNCYQFVPDPGKFSGLRNFFYFFLEEPIQQSSLSQSSQQTNPYSSERRLFFLSCTTRSKCFGVEDYHHHSKHNIRTVGGRIQNTLKNNNQNQNQMTTSQYSPQSSQSSQSQTSDDLLQDSQTANPNNSEPGPGTNVTTSRRTKNVNKRRKQNLNFKALSNLGPNNGGANHINNINYNNIDDDACSSSDFDKSVNNGDSSQLSECHSQSDQNLESLSLSISNSNLSMSQDDYNCCIYTDEEDSDAEMED